MDSTATEQSLHCMQINGRPAMLAMSVMRTLDHSIGMRHYPQLKRVGVGFAKPCCVERSQDEGSVATSLVVTEPRSTWTRWR